MKRLISILLAFALLCGAIPSTIAADAALTSRVSGFVKELRAEYAALHDSAGKAADLKAARERLKVTKRETKLVDFYAFAPNPQPEQVELSFFNGNNWVAYIDMDELFSLLQVIKNAWNYEADFHMDTINGDQWYFAQRENGSTMLADFTEGYVYFDDYPSFGTMACAINGGDFASYGPFQLNEDNTVKTGPGGAPLVNILERLTPAQSFTRSGSPLAVPLAEGHIPIYWYEGKGYMPVSTFSDLFLSRLETGAVYNGKILIVTSLRGFDDENKNEDGKTLKDIAFDIPAAKQRPKELAEYTYWELVMNLDCNYGLKEIHDIGDDFDAYFNKIGLKDRLMSQDPKVFTDALYELNGTYFGDFHSGLDAAGFYARDYWPAWDELGNITASSQNMDIITEYYESARARTDCVGEDGNPIPYREVGNTAYITFDHFRASVGVDCYDPEVEAALEDLIPVSTIALVSYANQQIKRPGSPVKNVVIDLSNNGGGQLDAAVFVISWVLGMDQFNTQDTMSGAQYTARYRADVNLDGKITDDDRLDLSKVHVFCLTSPLSFSCGNLTPTSFKDDGRVTLLGRKSGGGACIVQNALAPDGTVFQFSSRAKLCTVRNGSYYDVDQGIDPDVAINIVDHFYDRNWLTDFINSLP